jgi:acyl carrier protein
VLEADGILQELRELYARRGFDVEPTPDLPLADLGFRSLDFSELALRLEARLGRELNFGGAELRRLETVGDVVELLRASGGP